MAREATLFVIPSGALASGLFGYDVHFTAPEGHNALHESEQRIVPSSSHVLPGQVGRAALADDDRPDGDLLPGESLDAAKLRAAVSTIPG
jgi:hypothetical protein